MAFKMRIDLYIPDQDAPNALTQEQQDVIDRFRRDIIGASDALVSIGVEDGDYLPIFQSGSVHRTTPVGP